MSIHEHLPLQARRELKEVRWTKGWSWRKWRARRVRSSIVQPGCTKRGHCRMEEFKREVEKELTGKEIEPVRSQSLSKRSRQRL
jgi:hypothetical protein